MMGAALAKALKVRAPTDILQTAQNDFGWAKLATTATSAVWIMPKSWNGRYVYLYVPTGADVHVGITKTNAGTPTYSNWALASAKVDPTVAAGAGTNFPAASGAALTVSTVGMPIPVGQIVQIQLPTWDKNEDGFIVACSSSGAVTLYVGLGDGGV